MLKTPLRSAWFYSTLCALMILATSFKPIRFTEQTTQEFAKRILDAVKSKNYENFKKLFVSLSEYTDIVMATEESEETKMQMIEEFEQKQSNDAREGFDQLIERMTGNDIDFTKIIFEKAEGSDETEGNESFGLVIHFKSGDAVCSLTAYGCTHTKNGNRLSTCPYFRREAESDPTCDAFAAEMMNILKKDNKEEYAKMMITDADFIALVRGSKLTAEEQENVIEAIKAESPEKHAAVYYHRVMASIYDKEIDLSKITEVKYESKKQVEKGVSVASILVSFMYDGKNYEIKSREAFKTPKGWKLSRDLDFSSLDETDDADYEIQPPMEDVTDSLAEDSDYEKQMEEFNREIQRLIDSMTQAQRADSIRAVQEEKKDNKKKKKK